MAKYCFLHLFLPADTSKKMSFKLDSSLKFTLILSASAEYKSSNVLPIFDMTERQILADALL